MKKKVLLKSPILSTSGYGVNARTVLRALLAYEEQFDIFLEVINWGATSWLWYDDEERRLIDNLLVKTLQYKQATNNNPHFDIFVHCTILNEAERRAPVNIMVTAGIESNRIASEWVEKSQLVDKIIVVSQHAKFGFDNSSYSAKNEQTGEVIQDFKCQKPVEVINYPVRRFEPKSIDLELETDFNYLVVAQFGPRKNIEQTITWFIEENIDRKNVGLVCKLNTAANSIVDREFTTKRIQAILDKFPMRKCKVYLLHGDMTENEMASLYTHSKIRALISISPEGYGLPAFEASYYGLPVITFGWGGYTDFMYVPMKNSKGKTYQKAMFAEVEYEIKPIPDYAVWDGVLVRDSMWAYPKEGSFKVKMRDVKGRYELYKEMASQLKDYLIENFSEEKIYRQYAEAILGRQIKKVSVEDLPKTSIITSVFHAEEYLKGYLENLEGQTVWKNKCEAVLVHPKASPDYEAEKVMLDEFQAKYPGTVKVLEVEEDGGLYSCWNKAIGETAGECVFPINCDDRPALNAIELCAKELYSNEEVDSVYFDQLITQKPNETFENNSSSGKKYSFPEFDPEYVKMLNFTMHSSFCIRKSVFDKYGLFEEKYKSAGDWEFANRIASQGVKSKKMPEVLSLYYFSPRGLSTNKDNFSWKQKEEKEIYEKYKDVVFSK